MNQELPKRGRRNKADSLELRLRIFELYAQRKSPLEIAEIVGVSDNTVRTHIQEAFKEAAKPIIEDELQLDLEILRQTLRVAVARYLLSGDPADYGPIDKALDKRAKLLGLYTPEKHQHTVTEISAEDIELMELINEQRAKSDETLNALNEDTLND